MRNIWVEQEKNEVERRNRREIISNVVIPKEYKKGRFRMRDHNEWRAEG